LIRTDDEVKTRSPIQKVESTIQNQLNPTILLNHCDGNGVCSCWQSSASTDGFHNVQQIELIENFRSKKELQDLSPKFSRPSISSPLDTAFSHNCRCYTSDPGLADTSRSGWLASSSGGESLRRHLAGATPFADQNFRQAK
jgi:hypothetical protein